MNSQKSMITQKIIINASISEVYEAYTNSKKQSAFTGSKASGEPRVGSKFSAWDGYIQGKYIDLEKNSKVVQEWITTDWPKNFPASRLELIFKDLGDKTEISMIHSDVPAEMEDELRQGWIDFYWDPLKDYFENMKSE
jgi:activator of HSP90 ATPase